MFGFTVSELKLNVILALDFAISFIMGLHFGHNPSVVCPCCLMVGHTFEHSLS